MLHHMTTILVCYGGHFEQLTIKKWRFQWKWIFTGVRHAAPYGDHFGLLWWPFWTKNGCQNTKILRFGRNLVSNMIRVKNWTLIISCYVLTLFFIHTTSTCIVRLGDICSALRYSNQYFSIGSFVPVLWIPSEETVLKTVVYTLLILPRDSDKD